MFWEIPSNRKRILESDSEKKIQRDTEKVDRK
jgi:hypothetical protein